MRRSSTHCPWAWGAAILLKFRCCLRGKRGVVVLANAGRGCVGGDRQAILFFIYLSSGLSSEAQQTYDVPRAISLSKPDRIRYAFYIIATAGPQHIMFRARHDITNKQF